MSGACSTHGGVERCIQGLVGKADGERRFGIPRCRWEEKIKMELQEVGWGGVDWSNLAQDRDMWWAVVVLSPFHPTVKWALTLKH